MPRRHVPRRRRPRAAHGVGGGLHGLLYVCMYVCIYIYICIHMYVCMCIYIYIYIYIYIHMYREVCIYIYIYTHCACFMVVIMYCVHCLLASYCFHWLHRLRPGKRKVNEIHSSNQYE